jgi:hypothetical protein
MPALLRPSHQPQKPVVEPQFQQSQLSNAKLQDPFYSPTPMG